MSFMAHGYFAYVNEISFAYPEHLVHAGVASPGSDSAETLTRAVMSGLIIIECEEKMSCLVHCTSVVTFLMIRYSRAILSNQLGDILFDKILISASLGGSEFTMPDILHRRQ